MKHEFDVRIFMSFLYLSKVLTERFLNLHYNINPKRYNYLHINIDFNLDTLHI